VWWPALDAAGLPRSVRIHDLRHTCASFSGGPNGICTRATALKGRSKCLRDPGERGHLGSDQGFRLSASLDVSRRFPLSRAPYAPPRNSALKLRSCALTRVVSLSLPRRLQARRRLHNNRHAPNGALGLAGQWRALLPDREAGQGYGAIRIGSRQGMEPLRHIDPAPRSP